MQNTSRGDKAKQIFDFNVAMRRLVYLIAIGCILLLLYGLRDARKDLAGALGSICVGLMAAGASLLSGGLVGFVFGIPHTRFREDAEPGASEGSKQGQSVAGSQPANYRPNTSLEQISDWLTKMLVGVGLVEVKVIPGGLRDVARYLAGGLVGGQYAEAFVLTTLIYFSVGGFVFGFLWARLYLPRWFAEADEVKQLEEKVSLLEERQQADAKALELVIRLLNPQEGNKPVSEGDLVTAIKAASVPARTQVFYEAQKTSEDKKADDYDSKIEGVILIFRALIASDSKGRYHRNHAELSYALRRMRRPELAVAAITEAMQIRDDLKIKGWKYYEFYRAKCLIEQDAQFGRRERSDTALVERIVIDLRVCFSSVDRDKWEKWSKQSSVGDWMELNDIDITKSRS